MRSGLVTRDLTLLLAIWPCYSRSDLVTHSYEYSSSDNDCGTAGTSAVEVDWACGSVLTESGASGVEVEACGSVLIETSTSGVEVETCGSVLIELVLVEWQ